MITKLGKKNVVNLAIIGFGYWGPNLVRNFSNLENAQVKYICDKDAVKLQKAKKIYPSIITTGDLSQILKDKEIKGVVVATPPHTHFSIGRQALKAGKDLLLEKPMTTTIREARQLVKLADKGKRVLMVDHTFLFSEAVETAKKIIGKKDFGRIVNINAARLSLGLYQLKTNVIEDLAIHDISIIEYFLSKKPKKVIVSASRHFDTFLEDDAFVHIYYDDGTLANIHVSWLSPVKVRRMVICGSKKMLIYNDIESDEKIKVYDAGVNVVRDKKEIFQMKVGYRKGDINVPHIDFVEPLSKMSAEFVHCINTRAKSKSSGEFGLKVMQTLDLTLKSLKIK